MVAMQNTMATDAFSGFAMPLLPDELQGFRIDRFLGFASPETARVSARQPQEARGMVGDRVTVRATGAAAARFDVERTVAINDVMSPIADVNVARDLEWLGGALCAVSAALSVAGIGVVLGGLILG